MIGAALRGAAARAAQPIAESCSQAFPVLRR
jgi:hypothetical protein